MPRKFQDSVEDGIVEEAILTEVNLEQAILFFLKFLRLIYKVNLQSVATQTLTNQATGCVTVPKVPNGTKGYLSMHKSAPYVSLMFTL